MESSAAAALDLSLHSFSADVEDVACVEGSIRNRSGHSATITAPSPLRQWAETERTRLSNQEFQKYSSLRKLNVAFGIAKLLQASGYRPTRVQQLEYANIDNFVVRESVEEASDLSRDPGWEVIGIDMITPPMSLNIVSSPFSGDIFSDNVHLMGREVSANIIAGSFDATHERAEGDGSFVMWSLGVLLHFAFCGVDASKDSVARDQERNKDKMSKCNRSWNDSIKDPPIEIEEQPRKKSSLCSESDSYSRAASIQLIESPKRDQITVKLEMSRLTVSSGSESRSTTHDGNMGNLSPSWIRMLQELALPRVMIQLVSNLLGCGAGVFRPDDAYPSLQAVIDDVQTMLKEPNKYLLTSDSREWLSNIKYKLYGRSSEASKITDAFCRVGSTGDSEAVVIGGYSGCGKTRLVESVRGVIEAAGGYIVKQKFEQTSTQSRLTVVLTAFDELCLVIKDNNTPEVVNAMYEELINEFGANFQLLVRVLPNVVRMTSSDISAFPAEHQVDSNVNFFGLCHTIQRFMRVVSSCSHPIMLVLDDLQWADPISMGLVHSVLSDMKGSNVMLFVGTYRDNEVEQGHIIFGFLQQLVPFHVNVTKFHLDGISEVEVNTMISDALGMLPRFCAPLAQVITRKTEGNPYFVLEFLRSLIDNKVVWYSLREGCWLWDIDEIGAQDITSNVLDLLSNKLHGLSNSTQNALKVASCFGMKLPVDVAMELAGTQQYSGLMTALEEAVLDGFLHSDGMHYQFVHDNVRESAYTMISIGDRARFHFEIGMSLYSSCLKLKSDDKLFITIEQINHGVPSLLSAPSERISIVQLNCRAGLLAMKCSNFTSALIYSKAAVSLLPDDSWESHYQLTLSCYYQLAKSAIPCGAIDAGKQSSEKIIKHANCLDDKLDAYIILINVLHYEQDELSQALETCCHVLKMLGEAVPVSFSKKQIISIVDIVRTRIKCSFKATEDLLHMGNIGSKKSTSIMRFYDQLVILAYNSSPFASGYYISRFTRYCIDNKVMCRYTPMALVTFSAHLCYGFLLKSCQEGYRIGQIGLTLLNRSETRMEELSRVNTVYYGYVGVLFEPLQGCVDMHNLGYEVGMQTGNIVDAFFNLCFGIPWAIFAGSNLNSLKEEIAFYIRLAEQHSHTILATQMTFFQDTVLLLIGDKHSCTLSTDQSKIVDAIPLHLVQLIMPALYRGHFERVIYLHKKWESLDLDRRKRVPLRGILVAYYSGLAFAGIYRKKGTKRFLSSISDALTVLAKAVKLSEWNFKHKHSLLSAENFSIQGKNIEAELKYEDAIASAQSSKFIHEEALACELAGMHFKGKGNHDERALSSLRQAERCYTDWGSLVKARQLKQLIEMTSKRS